MEQDEVERLLAEYRATGKRSARNTVVEAHLGLARFAVRRFARGDRALTEDLEQVALLATVHAAERYRPGRGASFRTFARRTIDGELKRHFRDKTWNVRPPRTRQENYLRVCRAREELTQELRRPPRTSELAERTDLLVEEVLTAVEAGGARSTYSLDAPGEGDRTTERPETLSWETGFANWESHADLRQAIGALDERECEILLLRYVEEWSQPQIAVRLGISQSYVSRIIRRALAKLETAMSDERSALPPELASPLSE